jgi:hypothetical protein
MALALATFALSWQPSVAAQPVVQRCNRPATMMVNPMQQAKLATLRAEGEAVIARREEIASTDLSTLDFKAPGVSAETVSTLKSIADKPTDYGYSVGGAGAGGSDEVGPADFVKLGAVAALIGYIVYQQTL